jgi:hypothetical protein
VLPVGACVVSGDGAGVWVSVGFAGVPHDLLPATGPYRGSLDNQARFCTVPHEVVLAVEEVVGTIGFTGELADGKTEIGAGPGGGNVACDVVNTGLTVAAAFTTGEVIASPQLTRSRPQMRAMLTGKSPSDAQTWLLKKTCEQAPQC